MAETNTRYRRIEDPRKAAFIHCEINRHLDNATAHASRSIGCSGAAFVLQGMFHWTKELAAIDPAMITRYLRLLATIADPNTPPSMKRQAELIRRDLYQQICAGAGGVS